MEIDKYILSLCKRALLSSNDTPSIANEVTKSIEKSNTKEPSVPLGN